MRNLNFFSSDVSSKQFPRQRRRESFQSDAINVKQQSSKNRNNFYYDKRPPTRRNGSGGGLDSPACEAAGLMDADELNSVFNHGSKKQNLNHLLNFHYYNAKESEVARAGTFSKHGYHQHRSHGKKFNFNKEQYLQANCQFVVRADNGYDYRPFTISPDALVEWEQVVKIHVSSSEESQCPICLYPPKAAKMTRCGHIFCFACMLHYLSLSDKSWRKCPICYESVHLADLKSTTSKQNHRSYKVGDVVAMELMTREKGSLYVTKASEIRNSRDSKFPNFSDGDFAYAKLVMADHQEVLRIIEQERNELDFQLIEDGIDCPESMFVQQAMDLLEAKRMEVEAVIGEKKPGGSSLDPSVAEFVPLQRQETVAEDSVESHDKRNELIDDECNLTVNDIDIVPANSKHFFYYQAPNAQNVFLHSVNSRMLQQMYESLDKGPHNIQGKIVQIESCTMNEDLRKRLKYLQHLPVSSIFEVVEIEFAAGLVSGDVIDSFKGKNFDGNFRWKFSIPQFSPSRRTSPPSKDPAATRARRAEAREGDQRDQRPSDGKDDEERFGQHQHRLDAAVPRVWKLLRDASAVLEHQRPLSIADLVVFSIRSIVCDGKI